jgi:hypothetical protein
MSAQNICPFMNDAEFNQIASMDDAAARQLPPEVRDRFQKAGRWHARQRMSIGSTDGMVIGGMSVDEFLQNQGKS